MALDPFWAVLGGFLVLAFTLALHSAHLHGARHVRPHLQLARKAPHHLALALCASLLAGVLSGVLAGASYTLLYGPEGPLEPPLAALRARVLGSGGRHLLGLQGRPGHTVAPRTYSAAPVPAAVDLSQFAPAVGDQGRLNSCASWAVGYGLASYYAARSGRPLDRGGAPMFLYSQAAGGKDAGTTFPAVYKLLLRAGIDARARYQQGDYNYRSGPTGAEKGRAARWLRASRLRSWRVLFLGQGQGSYARSVLEETLATGNPVTLGVPVYDNIMNADRHSYFVQGAQGSYWGNHAVVAYRYDLNGVWVLNSWGSAWGLGGWVELSWSFVDRYALEADALVVGTP